MTDDSSTQTKDKGELVTGLDQEPAACTTYSPPTAVPRTRLTRPATWLSCAGDRPLAATTKATPMTQLTEAHRAKRRGLTLPIISKYPRGNRAHCVAARGKGSTGIVFLAWNSKQPGMRAVPITKRQQAPRPVSTTATTRARPGQRQVLTLLCPKHQPICALPPRAEQPVTQGGGLEHQYPGTPPAQRAAGQTKQNYQPATLLQPA